MSTWEFSCLEVSSQSLAKLQAVRWVGSAVFPPGSLLQRVPAGTAVMVQGISSPLPAGKHPPGCCCPLARVTHAKQGAAGGRTGTSSWGAAGLEVEMCFCSTGDCCRKKPTFPIFSRNFHFPHFLKRLKNRLMPVPCDSLVEMPLWILRRNK